MEVIDLHCDVLWKLSEAGGKLSFQDAGELDANLERLKRGKIKIQAFAIFVEPKVPTELKFQEALNQIRLFREEVIARHPEMVHLRSWEDFCRLEDGQIGAFLTLEGVDPIGNDLERMELFYSLGVMLVGLTWNPANLAADGIGEARGAGLSELGKEIVRMNNARKVFTDVSHLSERGFWDVIELADYPIASHSNARAVCRHPRNLSDEQAKALFQKGGMIHVIYNPPFTRGEGQATIEDLIKHIDHLCSLGGVSQIGLGSDFDGIIYKIKNLENASKTQNLILKLLKYYKEDEVRGFAYRNFLSHLPR
jgi:dipeptidase. Metallo peptidase. MEROPS family M19